jgi:hypothetical protein
MCSFFVAWNLQPETIFLTKILVDFHCGGQRNAFEPAQE